MANNLNEQQQLAITRLDGPLLVLAGAGTGKTRVLTHRLAELINQEKARPYQIMALTFTNKAAREMRHRTAQLMGEDKARDVWLGTFHSIGARLLRRYADHLGLGPNFTIINQDDQQRLLKNLALEQHLDPEEYSGKLLSFILNGHKDRAAAPEEEEEGTLRLLFDQYKKQMTAMNAVDFADLIYLNIKLWRQSPDVLAHWQNHFHYFLVDEYQDTNHAQYLFLKLLAEKSRHLACVGDDDQSIYSWRGADISNILSFQKDYPDATVIRLEQNYRSTQHILHCANQIIKNNQTRLGKELFTPKMSDDKVLVRECWDSEQEAELIARAVHQYATHGHDFASMAVLVRTSAQTRVLETRLNHLAIPYQVIGGAKFYDREEIRDSLAYLRLINNYTDDLAFRRIINKPKRGFGDVAMDKLALEAKDQQLSLFETLQKRITNRIEKSPRLMQLVATITTMHDQLQQEGDIVLADMASSVLEKTGYIEMWRTHKEKIEAEGRLENIKELFVAMTPYPNLATFLEEVSLATDSDNQEDSNRLSLMTIHAAKGLEFPTVFFAGWEEGLFPSPRTVTEEGQKGVEEERRLAYVGITRAMNRLIISYAKRRRLYGNNWQDQQPSRFLRELERKAVVWQKADGSFLADHQSHQPNGHVAVRTTPAANGYPPNPAGDAGRGRNNIDHSYANRGNGMRNGMDNTMTNNRSTSGHDNLRSFTNNHAAPPASGTLIGRTVIHPRFGKGKITNINGDVFDINFEDKSRWVLREFVDLLAS